MNKLYIVATPIGNLADITLRALEILRSVPLVACEDTRVTSKLLSHYQIKVKLISYHQHSDRAKIDWLVNYLKNEGDIALVTDAGTPGISDPGNILVAEAAKQLGKDCEIIPIPGPSAVIAALSISGFPTDQFSFLGFIPHKKGKETLLKKIGESEETVIFYESTHRIVKTLSRLTEYLGEQRRIVICRELTKKFESIYRGRLCEVLTQLEAGVTKGEFVVIIEGAK